MAILDNPSVNGASPTQIDNWLGMIQSSPTVREYITYFYLLQLSISEYPSWAGQAQTKPDAPFIVTKFSQATISIQSISALLKNTSVFVGNYEPFHVFVYLNDKTLIPYPTASMISTCFYKGLAARVLFERYKEIWQRIPKVDKLDLVLKSRPPTPSPLPKTPKAMELIAAISGAYESDLPRAPPHPVEPVDWINYTLNALNYLQLSSTWNNLGSSDFSVCLRNFTDASIQAAGLLQGWLVGDKIFTVASAKDRANCITAFNGLFNSRYTTRQLGTMVAYFFNYLSGFLQNERTVFALFGLGNMPIQIKGPTQITLLYNKVESHTRIIASITDSKLNHIQKLSSKFFHFVANEFYAVSQREARTAKEKEAKKKSLQNIQAFILGYDRGSSQAAAQLFDELFREGFSLGEAYGYSLGYADGFRDGYGQGYNAGWQAGYNSGFPAGQSNWISGLGSTLGQISTVLNDAKQVGAIIGDVVSVGEAIGSLF